MIAAIQPDDASTNGRAPVERLTYRIDELAAALGISRRTLERERSAGRFPKPDLAMGKMPLWRVDSVRDWLARGGR
jgi:predicted DNA-binding transcriptional regulator AlpA